MVKKAVNFVFFLTIIVVGFVPAQEMFEGPRVSWMNAGISRWNNHEYYFHHWYLLGNKFEYSDKAVIRAIVEQQSTLERIGPVDLDSIEIINDDLFDRYLDLGHWSGGHPIWEHWSSSHNWHSIHIYRNIFVIKTTGYPRTIYKMNVFE